MRTLENLKILDFTTLVPGPFATMMLADMGADVLRVESPTRPDMVRAMGPYADGTSTGHGLLNRNKRSIGLDLKKPEAVAIAKQLVAQYDIVIEQFRPGVMERFGLGYEQLSEITRALSTAQLLAMVKLAPIVIVPAMIITISRCPASMDIRAVRANERLLWVCPLPIWLAVHCMGL